LLVVANTVIVLLMLVLNTVATGNMPPQFILSAADVASIQQQALIQQLLQQNTLVIGCNSLLVRPADRSDAMPVNGTPASTGLHATLQAETDVKNLAGDLTACTGEVCVNVTTEYGY